MNSIHSVYLIDFDKVCRTCLCTGTLNPIFSENECEDDYSIKVFTSAGIKISSNDGLPQNMCTDCVNTLNDSIKFRERCLLTETKLLKIKNNTICSEDTSDGTKDSECDSFKAKDRKVAKRGVSRKKSVIIDAKSLAPENPLELEITFDSTVKTEKHIEVKKERGDFCELGNDTSVSSDILQIDSHRGNCDLMIENRSPSRDEVNSPINDSELSLDDDDLTEIDSNVKTENTNASTGKWNLPLQNSNPQIYHFNALTDNLSSSIYDSCLLVEKSYRVIDKSKHINLPKKKKRCNNFSPVINVVHTGEDNNRRVICKLCGKNLSVRSVNSHMLTKHPQVDGRREKCDMCEKMILRNKMEKHRIKFHGVNGDTTDFVCGYCKSTFYVKEVLKEHINTCTHRRKRKKGSERGREMEPCEVCGKTMQRASLRHHNAVVHSGLGPVCEHCGKIFANKIRLGEHCRAKHGYEKYKCNVCEFRSSGLMAMRNHERRHRGEKPFVCETCGAKFHAAYLLSQHRQTHRKEKVVKCDLCSASFKANNSLHMHKITCHSNCTYKCYLCERIFSCRHYVVKHLRHFHSYQGKVGHIDKIEGKVLPGRGKTEQSKKTETNK